MVLTDAEKSKRYRERHPDRFRASLKKYWAKKYRCPCGKIVSTKNKAIHKKSNLHEIMLEYQQMKKQIDRIENPEKYEEEKQKQAEKVKCECGGEVSYAHMSQHKKTKYHLEYMEATYGKEIPKRKQKVKCECGVELCNSSLSRHKKKSCTYKQETKTDSETD